MSNRYRIARIGDIDIHYELADYTPPWRMTPAETFLLYHGYARNMLFWQQWVPLLATDYRVLRFDARGCGETTKPAAGSRMSFAQLAADAIGLMNELKIDRVHWVGESSGGIVGMTAALDYPDRIATLTLCDTPFKRSANIAAAYTLGEADRAAAFDNYGVGGWCRKTLSYRLDTTKASPHVNVNSIAASPISRAGFPGLVCGALLALLAPGIATQANAQTYPAKTIRMIVGSSPGGPIDLVARLTAQKLTEMLGQAVVVENRTGAGGTIATEYVSKAAPDGYTLLMASAATLCVTPHLYSKIGYDTLRDFAPVSTVAGISFVLVVHPSLPVKSVKEFIVLAQARPGQLYFGSAGSGSVTHLAVELFKSMARLDAAHVPYKGAGPALIDLLAGQTQFMFNSIPTSTSHIRSGKLRALAVSSASRSTVLPELPTISEAGVHGYEAGTWFGLVAPAAVAREIVSKLNGVIVTDLAQAATRRRLLAQGLDPVGNSPEAFAKLLREELPKWGRVVKISGAKVD